MDHKWKYFDKKENNIVNGYYNYMKCEVCGLYEGTQINGNYKRYFLKFGFVPEETNVMPLCSQIIMESVLK